MISKHCIIIITLITNVSDVQLLSGTTELKEQFNYSSFRCMTPIRHIYSGLRMKLVLVFRLIDGVQCMKLNRFV